jgi:uncharacterized membrane protein
MSNTVEKSIDVHVPIRAVYNQWTQFEEFPEFMDGVREVKQINDKRLHWSASIGGKEKEWEADIVEQTPDTRIAWRSSTGAENSGVVSFIPIDGGTRVTVRLTYDTEGLVEKAGDALGFMTRQVEGDLQRFKQFIESRGSETGAWRGEIHGGKVESGSDAGQGGATSTGTGSV